MATARPVLWNVGLVNETDFRDNEIEKVRALTADEAGKLALSKKRGRGWSIGQVWRVQKPRKRVGPIKNPGFLKVLEQVRKRLGWPTMESRGRDHLDFHEVGTETMKAVLRMAYEAGAAL